MRHHTLREIAKFATGLVVADAFALLWLSAMGLLPVAFFGMTFGPEAIVPVLVCDTIFAILLAHYGWGIKLPVRTIRERTLLMTIGTLFAVVAFAHWTRIAFGLDLTIGGYTVPLWLSWIGVLATAYLSYASFHFALLRRV